MFVIKKNIILYLCSSLLLINCLLSCTSEADEKKMLVSSISKKMCSNISSLIGNEINQGGTGDKTIDALASQIIESLDVPLEDFCHCFTEIISGELLNKFSYAELSELRKDKIKQMMVASKIMEQISVRTDIENCLKGSLIKTGKKYKDYQNTLNEKFKN